MSKPEHFGIYHVNDPGAAIAGSPVVTVSGNEITDTKRNQGENTDPVVAKLHAGDGRTAPDYSIGIWPAATNLVTNGGFESDTTGWATNAPAAWIAAGATLTRETADERNFKFGLASGKVSVVAQQNRGAAFAITLSAGVQYTASIWVKGGLGTTDGAEFFFGEADAGIFTVVPIVILDLGDWKRYTATITVAADTACVVGVRTTLPAGNMDLYIDGIQVEAGAIATPYVHTDGGTATRAAARMQIPVSGLFTATQGWIAFKVRMGFASGGTNTARRLFDWEDDATHRLVLYLQENTGSFFMQRDNVTASQAGKTSTWAKDDVKTIIATWTATTVAISVDGTAFVSAANTLIPTLAAASMDIGSIAAAAQFSGDIFWFATGSGTLTDGNAASLHALGSTWPQIEPLVASIPMTTFYQGTTGTPGTFSSNGVAAIRAEGGATHDPWVDVFFWDVRFITDPLASMAAVSTAIAALRDYERFILLIAFSSMQWDSAQGKGDIIDDTIWATRVIPRLLALDLTKCIGVVIDEPYPEASALFAERTANSGTGLRAQMPAHVLVTATLKPQDLYPTNLYPAGMLDALDWLGFNYYRGFFYWNGSPLSSGFAAFYTALYTVAAGRPTLLMAPVYTEWTDYTTHTGAFGIDASETHASFQDKMRKDLIEYFAFSVLHPEISMIAVFLWQFSGFPFDVKRVMDSGDPLYNAALEAELLNIGHQILSGAPEQDTSSLVYVRPAAAYIHASYWPYHRLACLTTATNIEPSKKLMGYGAARLTISATDPVLTNTPGVLDRGAVLVTYDGYDYWCGFITSVDASFRPGTIEVNALEMSLALDSRNMPQGPSYTTGSGSVFRQAIVGLNSRGHSGIYLPGGGEAIAAPPVTDMDLSGESALKALEDLAAATGYEWWVDYLVSPGGIVATAKWGYRQGTDKSAYVILQEGRDFIDENYIRDTQGLYQSVTVYGGRNIMQDKESVSRQSYSPGANELGVSVEPASELFNRHRAVPPALRTEKIAFRPAVATGQQLSTEARALEQAAGVAERYRLVVNTNVDWNSFGIGDYITVRSSETGLGAIERKVRVTGLQPSRQQGQNTVTVETPLA